MLPFNKLLAFFVSHRRTHSPLSFRFHFDALPPGIGFREVFAPISLAYRRFALAIRPTSSLVFSR
jgi:hypothetical protein